MPAGRPSKFTTDLKKQIRYLAEKGFTEQEIADALLIDQSSITHWKKKYPEFFTALKDWKSGADRKVERSLYERACGASHIETKVFCQDGDIIKEDVQKNYAPDTAAAFIWLKNRRPEDWRDKTELEVGMVVKRIKKRFDGE